MKSTTIQRRSTFSVHILRSDTVTIDSERFTEVIGALRSSKYVKQTLREYAPVEVDCLTSVYYIFKETTDTEIPIYLIGDMPRMLTKLHHWKLCETKHDELKEGDLLFVKTNGVKRLINHVGIFGQGKVHHASKGGFFSETVEDFMKAHSQPYVEKRGEPLTILDHYDRRNIFRILRAKGYRTLS